jgi:tetratricopeptide (TPR) repeat protein
MDVELAALGRLADELRQPAQRWHVGTGHTMLALMEGRLEEAEELIASTLALGQRAASWNAVVTQRLALFVLRRAQGRLAEVEDAIARSVHEYPALLRFRCALAHLHGELGRERETRAALDDLLARDLRNEHLDAEWLLAMTLLADPCAWAGARDDAERLYSLLLPYEPFYAQAPVETVFGAVARALGVLATAVGRFDDAERHLEVAIDTELRMRAKPWLAHARHDLAKALLARAGPADEERALALLDEAAAAYRALGMATWAERAAALRPAR